MRRKEREIMDREELNRIIGECRVMRLAMAVDNRPYVVPLSFGFDGEFLYFHCAKEGLKIDYLSRNPQVCFEFEHDVELKTDDKPCSWGFHFKSIIGYGTVEELRSPEDKSAALGCIMRHYSGRDWDLPEKAVDSTAVRRIRIESMTGKQA